MSYMWTQAIRSWGYKQRVLLVLVTLAACTGCDQQIKALAAEHLRGRDAISFVGGAVRLDYAENPGAFLSLGDSLPAEWRTAVFTVGASLGITAVLLYTLLRTRSRWETLALALMCGGGLGNLIDRVLFAGYVRDFMIVGIGPLHTGIFNFADMYLMAGCAVWIWSQRAAAAARSR